MPADAPPLPATPLGRLQRYAEILADFGRMAPECTELDRLLQLACVQAGRGIGVGHVKAMRHRPEAGDLLVVAGVGWKPGVVGQVRLGTDLGSAPGQALHTREPVITDDLPHDPEIRYAPVLREHGIVSALNVPVVAEGVVWGVLEVDSDVPRHFGPDDARFLTALASILGLALQLRLAAERAAGAAADSARALAEQRTLFAELQHRNKNDLQLILALLVVQRRRQPDEAARRTLAHVMDRVTAIGMAHDQLSPGRGAGTVALAGYLGALCGNLGQRREGVRVEAALEPAGLPHERAVPLGLIVNELVTNALKHAFPGDRPGTIAVSFATLPSGEGRLCVRDDGVGLGPPRPGSSGTDLVQRLVRQVGGELRQEPQDRGAGFCLTFPLVT